MTARQCYTSPRKSKSPTTPQTGLAIMKRARKTGLSERPWKTPSSPQAPCSPPVQRALAEMILMCIFHQASIMPKKAVSHWMKRTDRHVDESWIHGSVGCADAEPPSFSFRSHSHHRLVDYEDQEPQCRSDHDAGSCPRSRSHRFRYGRRTVLPQV